jgi:hypothetical protein
LETSVMFRRCMEILLVAKSHLFLCCWKQHTESFHLVWHVAATTFWFGVDNHFSFSPPFLSHLLRVCVWLPEFKGIISFCFFIRFGSKSFDYYLFCFELILFFNFVPQNFDLFNFYIKSRFYSFECYLFRFRSFS